MAGARLYESFPQYAGTAMAVVVLLSCWLQWFHYSRYSNTLWLRASHYEMVVN